MAYFARKRRPSDIAANTNKPAKPAVKLTKPDVVNMIAVLTPEDIRSVVAASMVTCPITLELVRRMANNDLTKRKLFIRGLSWDTTEESLRSTFSPFGELEEVVVVLDKITGKSKGHGFLTFKNVDGALLALKQPNKKIDGRMTVAQLASTGNKGAVNKMKEGAVNKMKEGAVNKMAEGGVNKMAEGGVNKMDRVDVGTRKIYVGNVPPEMTAERLLDVFSGFGEIKEGMFDRQTRKLRGSVLLVYKTAEAARAATVEPMKSIDGFELFCKMAIDEKKSGNEGEGGPENQFGFSAGDSGGMQGLPHHHFSSPQLSFMEPEQPLPGSVSVGGCRSGGGSGGAGPYEPPSRISGSGAGGPVGPGRFGAKGIGLSSYNRGPDMMGSMGPCAYLEGGRDPYSVGSIGGMDMPMDSPPGRKMLPGGRMN